MNDPSHVDLSDRNANRDSTVFESIHRLMNERLKEVWVWPDEKAFDMLSVDPRDRDTEMLVSICHWLWHVSMKEYKKYVQFICF